MSDDIFPALETSRLRLRCIAIGDAQAVSESMTPEVSRWVATWPVPFTVEMAQARIEKARRAAIAGHALPIAVENRVTGQFIGWVGVNRNQEAPCGGSFGYWLGEAHHGKGYMREIASVVLSAGFDLLDLDLIEAAAQIGNDASFAVMRGCGMRPVGERTVYASARNRDKLCIFYEIERPGAGLPRL